MSGLELVELVKTISPEIVVPVHTEEPRLFQERLAGEFKVILPRDGERIEIA